MNTDAYPEPALWRKSALSQHATGWSSFSAEAAIEFCRFRVLLRRRRLLADGVPVELGSRAFDLLLVLLEAEGALVTREELFRRVWPGIVVSEENLKVQVSKLRKALGADRSLIHTEFGRGYRFIGILRSTATAHACRGPRGAKLRASVELPIIARFARCRTQIAEFLRINDILPGLAGAVPTGSADRVVRMPHRAARCDRRS